VLSATPFAPPHTAERQECPVLSPSSAAALRAYHAGRERRQHRRHACHASFSPGACPSANPLSAF